MGVLRQETEVCLGGKEQNDSRFPGSVEYTAMLTSCGL